MHGRPTRSLARRERPWRRLASLALASCALVVPWPISASATAPLAAAATAHGAAPAQHVVAPGESLSHLAERYGVSIRQLREWNDLGSDLIQVGEALVIAPPHAEPPPLSFERPGRRGPTPARGRADGAADREPDEPLPSRDAPPSTSASPAPDDRDVRTTHVVRPGDTLSEIAAAHDVSVSTLRDLNHMSGDRIYVGQVLRTTETDEDTTRDHTPSAEYIVQRGDTLSEIAQRFGVSMSLLRGANDLAGDTIVPGQRLRLTPSASDATVVHVVRPGESLSAIGQRYGVRVSELQRLNGLRGSRIYAGQRLRLRATPRATHVVERGDALWEIAAAYGMTVTELEALNGLTSSRIYPGQVLQLSESGASATDTYVVKRGDSLSEIALLHQMSLSELMAANRLTSTTIHPGQSLEVRPLLRGARGQGPTLENVVWSRLGTDVAGFRHIAAENGPYLGHRPRAAYQRSKGYLEESGVGPWTAYRRASTLLAAFDAEVDRMPRLSNRLAGWHIVLDPGHGGIDPGTISKVLDGRGDPVFVVEDEYVYDITLRMYVLLRLHGADVTLTLLSPNHLIRASNPATRTFVHERNEVYNDREHNRRNGPAQWPRGGQAGLDARIDVARAAFAGARQSRRLFLSIHADNSPGTPNVPLILYYASRSRTDGRSRGFARALLPSLGAGAQMRGQNLGVLRHNPADFKLLVEVRNVAYADEAWCLRFEELRQRDAEKVVRGVLNTVKSL